MVFELIHADLCGPISSLTKARNQYIFLVDDYSPIMWAYMLKNKDEIFEVFRKYKAMVENERKETIKVFLSDTGAEFLSSTFIVYRENIGITGHLPAPYLGGGETQ